MSSTTITGDGTAANPWRTEPKTTQRIVTSRLVAELECVQKRASVRTLDESDVHAFVAQVRKARSFAKRHDLDPEGVYVEVNGGAVCNAYNKGYRAGDSTFLIYSRGEVRVCRDEANRRAHGADSDVCRVHVGPLSERPGLRKARSVDHFHGGYAYL